MNMKFLVRYPVIKKDIDSFYYLLRILFCLTILFSGKNTFSQWSKLYQVNDMRVYRGNNMLLPENLIVDYSLFLDSCYGPMLNNRCSDQKLKPNLSIEVVADVFLLIKNAVNSGNVGIYFEQNDNAYELINDCSSLSNIVNAEDMPSSYSGFRFIEQWNADDSTKVITKKVITYMPLVKSFINDPNYDQDPNIPIIDEAFVVLNSLQSERMMNESNDRMIRVNRIKYEYFFYTNNNFYDIEKTINEYDSLRFVANSKGYKLANPNSLFLNDYSIIRYISKLVQDASMGNIKSCDFISDSIVPPDEIESILGLDISYWDHEGNFLSNEFNKRIEREKELYNNELLSVIFIEDWYIDPLLLRFKKEVIGIAPVLYIRENNQSDSKKSIQRIIPVVFYF